MAAHTLAPADYSPDRDTPKAALAMLIAVAIFGLWRGFAHEFAAERVGAADAPTADAASPRIATALPAVDLLTSPEPEPAPAVRVANVAKPQAAPLDVVVTGESPAGPAADAQAAPPTVQESQPESAPPPVEDEPPPDDFDPYN